jgi:hypothetical protein
MATSVGFRLPVLEGIVEGKAPSSLLKPILGLSIGMGILATILIILLSCMFVHISSTLLSIEMSIPTWKAFLASFYGGIAEEVLCRLFLMTLLVWISFKIKTTQDRRPTSIGIWLSILGAGETGTLLGAGRVAKLWEDN